METITTINKNVITIEHKLNQKELEILKHVEKTGFIELGISYEQGDRFDSSELFRKSECNDLIYNELLIRNNNAFHNEYRLSDLAKKIINQ